MKKLLYSAAALATLLFAASCQQENLGPARTGVTYTITLADEVQTKGKDGHDAYDLYYEVYRNTNAGLVELYDDVKEMTGPKTTVTLDLLNDQDYTVLFWANKKGTDYFNASNLQNVTIKDASSNNEDRDAFCGMDELTAHDNGSMKTVTLTRPFAQLNIATLVPTHYDVDPQSSLVKVTGAPKSFSVLTGEGVENSEGEVTYTVNTVPGGNIVVAPNTYKMAAMNYVFAPEGNITVYYEINTNNGTVKNTINNVPVKKNYRTNIIGNLLTSDATYTVDIKPGFETVDEVVEIWDGKTKNEPQVVDGNYIIKKASEFAWLEAPQVLSHDVVLMRDIDMGGKKFQGILSNGKKFDGAGYTLKNVTLDYASQHWSSLFVTGGGSVASSNIYVKNLTIDGAYVLADKNSNGNAAVIASYAEAKAEIENVHVKNSTVYGTIRTGAIVGFVTNSGDVLVKNCSVDGVTINTFNVPEESGAVGGVVGGVVGKLVVENTPISNSTINAYVNDGAQKRTVSKYIGNFYGSSASLKVTGGSINNVTLNLLNGLAQTQSCLYTEYLGGWREVGGTVSINGIEITKDQTNDDITIDTSAELATAISNAVDGAVIPVSGEITTNSLTSGNNITIVGMSEGTVINSSADRLTTSGNITFKNLTLTLPTTGDYYKGHNMSGGTLVFDNCKFVGCVCVMNANVTYNNCEFTNPDKYAAWVYSGKAIYNNCTFTGPDRAVKVYAENANAPEVYYNNCTFKALTAADDNKTAVEVDCKTRTSGTPYYVEINNPTIENMGIAEHNAIGDRVCNLETNGVGLGIVTLNGKGYSVAHKASQISALADAGKSVTIEVAADITENVSFTQKKDLDIVLDGKGKEMNGTINITARAGKDAAGSLVIKDFNFKTTETAKSFIISSETNYYPNNVTVSGCTFEGPSATSDVVPVTLKSSSNFVMENCTATGVHSLLQNTSGWNLTVRNCEVTNAGRGISLSSCQGVLVENVKIQASNEKYGIRADGAYANTTTIKNCEISAFCPVVVRKASAAYKLVFDGTNTMTAANTDGLWCVIGDDEYEANGVMPGAATGAVTVTLNDAGLSASGVYGASNL